MAAVVALLLMRMIGGDDDGDCRRPNVWLMTCRVVVWCAQSVGGEGEVSSPRGVLPCV